MDIISEANRLMSYFSKIPYSPLFIKLLTSSFSEKQIGFLNRWKLRTYLKKRSW